MNKLDEFEKECNEEIDKIFSALETKEDLFNNISDEIEIEYKKVNNAHQAFAKIVLIHVASIEAHLIRLNHMEVWIKDKLEEIKK